MEKFYIGLTAVNTWENQVILLSMVILQIYNLTFFKILSEVESFTWHCFLGKEFYICDFKGHCVVVFNEEGKFVRRIGHEHLTNFPNGIDISDAGDVLIGDSHGNRFHVSVFSRDGTLISEFECPYVKVSY